MLRRHLDVFKEGTARNVVLHGAIRRSRGRNPSKGYRNVRNPRLALAEATKDVLREIQDETLPGLQPYTGTPMLFQALGLGNSPFDPRVEASVAANFDKKFAAWAGITT